MSVSQSLLVALFCMGVVFAALLALWGVIRLFTAGIRAATAKNKAAHPGKGG